MPWDQNKCLWGYPPHFTNQDAAQAVALADFNNAVFVNTSQAGQTRQAYTYVVMQGYRICVVGHIHPQANQPPKPGNAFIPGWLDWAMPTPTPSAAVIAGLPDGGNFPGDNRYPHRV
ncbi:MAG TPA: hypothetical protein VIM93_00085 [Kangiella sp.]